MATAMATAIADDDAIDAPWAVVSDALDGDADVWSEEDSNARAPLSLHGTRVPQRIV